MKFENKFRLKDHINELVKSGYLIEDEIIRDNENKGGISILKCYRVNYRFTKQTERQRSHK